MSASPTVCPTAATAEDAEMTAKSYPRRELNPHGSFLPVDFESTGVGNPSGSRRSFAGVAGSIPGSARPSAAVGITSPSHFRPHRPSR